MSSRSGVATLRTAVHLLLTRSSGHLRDAVSRPVCRLAGWVLKQTVRSTSSWNQTMHARVDEACPSTGSSGTANVVELFERAASGEGGVENVVISSSCRFQNESSRERASGRQHCETHAPQCRLHRRRQHSAEMSMGPFFCDPDFQPNTSAD